MAKVLCIVALAGLASAAPTSDPYQYRPRNLNGNTAPSTTFSATLTQGPQYQVETTGTISGENVQGHFSGVSSHKETSSSFNSFTDGAVANSGSSSAFGSSSNSASTGAVVNQVTQLLAPQIEK